jgi:transposase
VARAKNGQAIHPDRRTPKETARLRALLDEAEAAGDLDTWRRAKAIAGYLKGTRVVALAQELGVDRSAINKWMRWYDADGADGLRTGKAPGAPSRLTEGQLQDLAAMVEAGPQAAGYLSGVWTLATVRDWIQGRFGVTYHISHVARLLHELNFSVQRPRKRLARADRAAQEHWLKERLPAIKKKPAPAGASSSSKTKRPSGSTAHSTKRGRGSGSSRA